MKQKIGIVQTRGIGDIIISLPIADHFIEQGCEVYWPIDHRFVEMFAPVRPKINFLSVDAGKFHNRDFFLNEPLRLLRDHELDRTILLYSYLGGLNICDTRLANSLKFDEYKYAIAGVPFAKKWDLKLERDHQREQELFDRLAIDRDYIVVHDRGYDLDVPIKLPEGIEKDFQVIYLSEITETPFDWILTLEQASELFMIDSSMANLVEQLNLTNKKRLFLRSECHFTPVYKNGWVFSFFSPAEIQ